MHQIHAPDSEKMYLLAPYRPFSAGMPCFAYRCAMRIPLLARNGENHPAPAIGAGCVGHYCYSARSLRAPQTPRGAGERPPGTCSERDYAVCRGSAAFPPAPHPPCAPWPPPPSDRGGSGSTCRRCAAAFINRPPYGLLGPGSYCYCRGAIIRR